MNQHYFLFSTELSWCEVGPPCTTEPEILDTTVVVPPLVNPEDETKSEEAEENNNDNTTVDETEENDGSKAPVQGNDETSKDETVKNDEEQKGTIVVDGKKYTVKKGDCVWNIAKKLLTEENNGVKPTNAQIAVRTKEIMEANNLKYANKDGLVIIHPEQELKVA